MKTSLASTGVIRLKNNKPTFVKCIHCNSCPYKVDGFTNAKCQHFYQEICTVESVNRYGAYTLEAIGEGLGCTRERIRQIEMLALKKIRKLIPTKGRGLRDTLEYMRAEGRRPADQNFTGSPKRP